MANSGNRWRTDGGGQTTASLKSLAIVRNKANFRRCADREIGVPGGPIVRNKPNSGGRRHQAGAGSRGPGLVVQTKPIGRGVPSGKCQVSSWRSGHAGSDPPSLPPSNCPLPTPAGPPCCGMRKTNPIPGGPDIPPFHYAIIPSPSLSRKGENRFSRKGQAGLDLEPAGSLQ